MARPWARIRGWVLLRRAVLAVLSVLLRRAVLLRTDLRGDGAAAIALHREIRGAAGPGCGRALLPRASRALSGRSGLSERLAADRAARRGRLARSSGRARAREVAHHVCLCGRLGETYFAGHPLHDGHELLALGLRKAGIHLENAGAAFRCLEIDVGVDQPREQLKAERVEH